MKTFLITPVKPSGYTSVEIPTGAKFGGAAKAFVSSDDTPPTDAQMSALFAPVPPVRQLSKLEIRRKLRGWGKEDAFNGLLTATPHAQVDWDDAQVIKTSDPLFTANAAAFKAALGLTDEQFAALLTP
jgi:hypothetical protein